MKNNQEKLVQFLGDDPEFNAAMLIALIESRISRICTSMYFDFAALGESAIIFTDELRKATDDFLQTLDTPSRLVEVEGMVEDTIQIGNPEAHAELTTLLQQTGHLQY